MKQTKLPFYLKRSSALNKLIQLAIAIVTIIVVMNLWINNNNLLNQSIENHFEEIGKEYLMQSSEVIQLLSLNKEKELITDYLQKITESPWVKDIRWYDATGQLILGSENSPSISELYGISPQSRNQHQAYVPFIQEIRQHKLQGYLRISLDKKAVLSSLKDDHYNRDMLLRLMIILAGVTGFFLTRAFNRFSRQGYRIKTS